MGKVQVLVVTMNQSGFDLFDRMRLHTDVIFANQNAAMGYQCEKRGKCSLEMITTMTKGVGINRNIALSLSQGDFLLIADDDIEYTNDYEKIVLDAFSSISDADGIIFNIDTVGAISHRRQNERIKRIRWYNALNYGAARIAVKRTSIMREGIFFNHNFGGGCIYSAGEDVLFVVDMLKHGLKLYSYPVTLGRVDQTSSTWFEGYNKKFFYDKGALFAGISRKWAYFLCLQAIGRHWKIYKESGLNRLEVFSLMLKGIRGYTGLIPYETELI